ncbi:MAG: ATP-binding protein, partial [Bacteroidota bacterium]
AIKFTNSGGRISIFIHDFGKEIEVAISDTGIGIPEKDLPNLFQKFGKVTRPGALLTGAGFGLVSTKQIIDLHKGFVKVRSEEDKGTTFIIRLPK